MRKILSTGKYAVMTVLILFLTFLITGNTAKADAAKHNNIGDNDYFIWNATSLSFITPTSDGGYMIFDAGSRNSSEGYIVEYYDSNYNFVSSKTIPVELPVFGGFYSDGSNYYLVTGQGNPEESATLEVYRVTKYNTSWIRQGAASLKDCDTAYPFDAGSVDMASAGGKLFVRTCHEMYKSSDGYNHQANVTILINISDMSILDCHDYVWNYSTGYCSHSFNQLAAVDGNYFIGVDHGDAHPRSIMVTRYNNAISSGSLSGVNVYFPYSFSGETRNNYTGASVGGLGVSSSSYLVSANSVQQEVSGSTTRNILIATVNKSTGDTGTQWITSNAEGDENCTTPYLIKINDNRFLVLWTKGSAVQYAFVDGTGALQGNVYNAGGMLSDCRPALCGGNVVWYTYDGTQINFFEINGSTGEFVSKNPINIGCAEFADIPATVYTGSKIEPKTTVTFGGQTLKRGVDYSVKYQNNLNAGYAKITYTGKGNFNGSVTKYFLISRKNISELTIPAIPDIPYTGSYIYPNVEIKYGDIELVEYQDYYTDSSDNNTVGKKTLTITGYRNYTGSVDVPFNIVKANVNDLEIRTIPDRYYTGSAITPTVDISNNGSYLTEDTDFTVSYSNNKKIGTAKVTITGIGNYTGTKEVTFRILPRSVNNVTVMLDDDPYYYYAYYTGKAIKPKVTLTDGSKTLVKDTDYTISFSDNVNVGTGKITITGIGSYGDTREITFSIYPKSIYYLDISLEGDCYYTGSAITPAVTVKDEDRGVTLKKDEDYTVECTDNTSVGWAYVTIKGKNNYSGSYSGYFYIYPRDLATTTVALEKQNWYYTGKAIEPKVIVKANKKTLKEGKDYTLSYSDNVNVGTGTITVTGVDNCYGTASISFEIKEVMPDITLKKIDEGVEITWNAIEIADKYRVFRKNSNGGWDKIATLSALKYVDKNAQPGDPNTYTVRVVDSDGKVLGQYGEGKSISFTADPVEIGLANKSNGVTVSWEAVENAAKYRVFRKKADDTSWEKLGTTTSLKYSDKKAVFSETYLYSVRALTANGNFINRYGNGTEIKHLIGAPKLTLTNSENGIDVTWKPMTNAAKYKVYVKNARGTWTRLATISSGTTYTDTATEQGKSYTYSVLGLDADGHVMNENGDGYSLVRNNAFVKVEAECTTDGLILFWNAYEGAAKYRVYRKNSSGKWTKIATIAETVYTDADAAVNAENVYAVLAIDSDGNKLSDYGNGKTVTFIIPPTTVEAVTKSSGVRLEWASVIKAERYALYRKTKSTDWTKVGATSGLSYTDKSAESGKTYFYSVIALDGNGKALNDYGEGVKIKFIKPVSDELMIEDIPELEGSGAAVEEVIEEEITEAEITEEETAEEETSEEVITEEETTEEAAEDVIAEEENAEETAEEIIEETPENSSEEIAEDVAEEKGEEVIEPAEEENEESIEGEISKICD